MIIKRRVKSIKKIDLSYNNLKKKNVYFLYVFMCVFIYVDIKGNL